MKSMLDLTVGEVFRRRKKKDFPGPEAFPTTTSAGRVAVPALFRDRPDSDRRALCLSVIALGLPFASSGCASRFAPSDTPLPPLPPTATLHPNTITNGDVIEVAYYFTGRSDAKTYRVDVGDILRIQVSDHAELDRDDIGVLPDGSVSLPLLGTLPVMGLTLAEIASAAESGYSKARLRNPRVVISITRSQSRLRQFMQHLGADRGVNKVSFTVFDKDPLEMALIPPVAIDRPLSAIREDIRAAYGREFGDQLAVTVNLVRRAEPTLYVMGEVKKPGAMGLVRPVNLVTAIANAGGFTDTADETAILVLRPRPDFNYDYWTFDLKSGLLSEEQQGRFSLQGNDVVYVARSRIADVNLFVRQFIRGLLPFELGAGFAIQVR